MKLYVLLVVVFYLWTVPSFAGNGGRGDIPNRDDIAGFTDYVRHDGLKHAILDYLDALQTPNQGIRPLDKMEPQVRVIFDRMLKDGKLQTDVNTPNTYEVSPECRDKYDGRVLSGTDPGKSDQPNIGGKICFDVAGIVKEYEKLSIEEKTIRFVSIALHEYVHHFQDQGDDSPAIAEQNENEAGLLGGYVARAAKFLEEPRLTWKEPEITDSVPARFDLQRAAQIFDNAPPMTQEQIGSLFDSRWLRISETTQTYIYDWNQPIPLGRLADYNVNGLANRDKSFQELSFENAVNPFSGQHVPQVNILNLGASGENQGPYNVLNYTVVTGKKEKKTKNKGPYYTLQFPEYPYYFPATGTTGGLEEADSGRQGVAIADGSVRADRNYPLMNSCKLLSLAGNLICRIEVAPNFKYFSQVGGFAIGYRVYTRE